MKFFFSFSVTIWAEQLVVFPKILKYIYILADKRFLERFFITSLNNRYTVEFYCQIVISRQYWIILFFQCRDFVLIDFAFNFKWLLAGNFHITFFLWRQRIFNWKLNYNLSTKKYFYRVYWNLSLFTACRKFIFIHKFLLL